MDYLVNLLVKFMVFLSRFAPVFSKLGMVHYRGPLEASQDGKLHLLLVGYNGAQNTGSDVRVAEIARQLQERLGKERVEISVMTMDVTAMRCYFSGDVHLIPCSAIFFGDVFQACCANQAVILCEGSTLKSKFANALTLYSCEAAGIMKKQHKPCIAYGSEAGEMDAFLKRTVKKLCSDTYFIARTQQSLDQIQQLGLAGQLGTDTAWKFDSGSATKEMAAALMESGWNGTSPLLGIAPINPFWWPVKPSLFRWIKAKITGDHSLQFRLWYFFSTSKQREQQFETYLNAIAEAINNFAVQQDCYVVLLGMERLDQDAVNRLQAKLQVPCSAFLSADHDGTQMAALLRQLDFLVTSRYHAEVLSMKAQVPCVAISMDERLQNLMEELGMEQHQLLSAEDPNLSADLQDALTYVQGHQEQIKEEILQQFMQNQDRFDAMGDFLLHWLLSPSDAV